MRTLSLGLSLIFLLAPPCFAQTKKKDPWTTQKYDISDLITVERAPAISFEAFLLSHPEDLPLKLEFSRSKQDQPVTMRFTKAPLREIIKLYQSISRMSLACSLDLNKKVNHHVRNVPLGDALLILLDELDADATFKNSVLFIHEKGKPPLNGLPSVHSMRHRRHIIVRMLRRSFPNYEHRGKFLRIEGNKLIARQGPKDHASIKKQLVIMKNIEKFEAKYWDQRHYLSKPFPDQTLNQKKEKKYHETLQRESLATDSFERTIQELFEAFKVFTRIPYKFDSSIKHLTQREVSFQLSNYKWADFLDTISTITGLNYAVSPEGVEFFKFGFESSYHSQRRRRLRAYLKQRAKDKVQHSLLFNERVQTGLQQLDNACLQAGFGLSYKNADIEPILKTPYAGSLKQKTLEKLLIDVLKPHKLHYRVVYRSLEIMKEAEEVDKNFEKAREAILKKNFDHSPIAAMTPLEFIEELSEMSQVPICFPEGLSSSSPINITEKSTIGQALKIASSHSGLNFHWLSHKGKAFWAITCTESGLFQKSERALKNNLTSKIPAVQKTLKIRSDNVSKVLAKVRSQGDFSGLLDKFDSVIEELSDVQLFIRDNQEFLDKKEAHLLNWVESWKSDIIKLKSGNEKLMKLQFDSKSLDDNIAKSKKELKKKESTLKATKKALADPKISRAERFTLQDKLVQIKKSMSAIQKDITNTQGQVLARSRRFDREKKAALIRYQQRWRSRTKLHGEAAANAALFRALEKYRKALKKRAWAEVFPQGWRAQRDKICREALRQSAKLWINGLN